MLTSRSRKLQARRVWRLIYRDDITPPSSTDMTDPVYRLILNMLTDIDFAPIISGDQTVAKRIAYEAVQEVYRRAQAVSEQEDAEFTMTEFETRWREILTDQVQSAQAFVRLFQARVKQGA